MPKKYELTQFATVTVPSYRRPGNVPLMQAHYPKIIWVVADRQDKQSYEQAGAHKVVIREGKGLLAARNTCLAIAREQGNLNLQLDDDISAFHRVHFGSTESEHRKVQVPFEEIAQEMIYAMFLSGTYLTGILPHDNQGFAEPQVHTWAFCIARCVLVSTLANKRWPGKYALKEDWAMTLKHLKTCGAITRLDYVLVDTHNTGYGGLHNYRTAKKEVRSAKYLLKRYPEFVKKHPTKAGELLLRNRKRGMPDSAKQVYELVNR